MCWNAAAGAGQLHHRVGDRSQLHLSSRSRSGPGLSRRCPACRCRCRQSPRCPGWSGACSRRRARSGSATSPAITAVSPPAPRSASGSAPMCCIGGSNNSVALQPLSVEGQAGLNVFAGVAGLELRFGALTLLFEHNPSLDAGASRCRASQIIHHLVRHQRAVKVGHDFLAMREAGIAVIAARHEIVGRDLIDFRCRRAARCRP